MWRIVGAGLIGHRVGRTPRLTSSGGISAARSRTGRRTRLSLAGVARNAGPARHPAWRPAHPRSSTQTKSIRLCWHSIVSEHAPASVAASGCAAHAAQPGGQRSVPPACRYSADAPPRQKVSYVPLHDSLTADIDPASGRHLTVHSQPFSHPVR